MPGLRDIESVNIFFLGLRVVRKERVYVRLLPSGKGKSKGLDRLALDLDTDFPLYGSEDILDSYIIL